MATELTLACDLPGALAQIEEIFWETSARQEFPSAEERQRFLDRYLGEYLRNYPQYVWVARQGDQVLGYILGVASTSEARTIRENSPHLELFEDMYGRYPAHLHINCRAQARGHGVGSDLVKRFERELVKQGVTGVHLITSPTARNVGFYLKNGYAHKVERLWNDRPLLLLGKTLQV